MDLGDWTRLEQLRNAIASELDILVESEIRIYSDRGLEIIDDEDVCLIPRNGIIFVTTGSISDSHLTLDETFNYRNCLVPYEIERLLGEVNSGRGDNIDREDSGR